MSAIAVLAADATGAAAVPLLVDGGLAETLRVGAIVAFVVIGLFFTLVSATGVLRLPDIYSRAHTASQADTLGAGFALAAVALALGWDTTSVKTVLLLFFIFVTNPTAAHAIARAAHEEGIEPWTTDDDRTDQDLYEDAQSPEEPDVLTDGGASAGDESDPARDVDEGGQVTDEGGQVANEGDQVADDTGGDRA